MNVELVLEGRPIDIVAEGFDAGIRLAESVPQDMVAIPCGPDSRFIVVGAPLYFARTSVPRSPSDLLNHECIRRRMPGGKLYRWEFEKRGEAMDHVLLYGPPGLGKTTLAQIIANELQVPIKTSAGPLLERKGDLTAILTSLETKEVFFLDEIHRLVPAIEEVLYPAMEDYRIDLVIGQGAGARIHPFILNRFTLIGATTRAGLVTAPLRSRFGIVHRLEFYTPEDLVTIVRRSASILGIAVDDDGAFELARRSRGTPRVANRLLRRARDFAQVRAQGHITLAVAKEALQMLGVDEHGLDEVDRTLMLTILQKYAGGPVGLSTLAASISEEEDAIEEIYEPYLMQLGLLDRTQRGRVATALAYKHFSLEPPRRQPGLF
jgi:Holliday junction DNA helicase RuvB